MVWTLNNIQRISQHTYKLTIYLIVHVMQNKYVQIGNKSISQKTLNNQYLLIAPKKKKKEITIIKTFLSLIFLNRQFDKKNSIFLHVQQIFKNILRCCNLQSSMQQKSCTLWDSIERK